MNHRWMAPFRELHRTIRICDRCGIAKISHHQVDGGRPIHWTEWRHGGWSLHPSSGSPKCEPAREAVSA